MNTKENTSSSIWTVFGLLVVLIAIGAGAWYLGSPSAQTADTSTIPSGLKVAYIVEKGDSFKEAAGDVYLYSMDSRRATKIYSYEYPLNRVQDEGYGSGARKFGDNILISFEQSQKNHIFTLIGLDGKENVEVGDKLEEIGASFYVLSDDINLFAYQDPPSNQPIDHPVTVLNLKTGKKRTYPIQGRVAGSSLIPMAFSSDKKFLYLQADSAKIIDTLNLETGELKTVAEVYPGMLQGDVLAATIQQVPGEPKDLGDTPLPETEEIGLINLLTSEETVLRTVHNGTFSSLSLSPNQKVLLFTQDTAGGLEGTGWDNTYVMDVDRPDNARKLLDFSGAFNWWSKDSRFVLAQPWYIQNQTNRGAALVEVETGKVTYIPGTATGAGSRSKMVVGLFE